MFDRILVPLDGSRRAEAALPPLHWIASPGADILLLRACPLRPVGAAEASAWLPIGVDEARGYLDETAALLQARGLRARALLRESEAAEAILDAAAEEGATLVVLTTHGRSGLARFVFGSVTEKVLRASPVPVMVFPAFDVVRVDPPRRVLVPVDGDFVAPQIAPAVAELARRHGADVTLLHVAEEGRPAAFPRGVDAALAAENVGVARLALQGDPAARILDAAREADADLLVMTTHGRRGPSRWIFGSVTEKVLRGAGRPLLVVRNAPVPNVIASATADAWKE